jgi:hypothetical protein
MKNTIMLITVLVLATTVNACSGDESCELSDADSQAIMDRIESLEVAINSNNIDSFKENIYLDTNQWDSFVQDSLDALTEVEDVPGVTDYNFHDYNLSCSDENNADASCTATITPGDFDEPTSFTLIKDVDWYITVWEEGDPAEIMYDSVLQPK